MATYHLGALSIFQLILLNKRMSRSEAAEAAEAAEALKLDQEGLTNFSLTYTLAAKLDFQRNYQSRLRLLN